MEPAADGRRKPSPAILILAASIASGATGYLVTWIVASRIGAGAYAEFAVFWSALFIVVGAFGGVQQEVTRATSAREPGTPAAGARLSVFALVLGASLFALIAATSPLWAPVVFAGGSTGFVLPLAVGAASYVLVAALCGALYGIRLWYPLALLIVIDGVLRLVGVVAALFVWDAPGALGWAVAAPFPLAIIIVLPFIARRVTAAVLVDVGYRQLGWNVARTIVAAAATATLISGFPLLLRATSPDAPAAAFGSLVLALTLTRAPIVIPLLSLQSYLVVHFGDHLDTAGRRAVRLVTVVLAAALALGLLAAWLGPGILSALFGEGFAVEAWTLFVLVASSGLVAGLCVTGPAVLARGAHSLYVAGWLVASSFTIVLLLLPLGLEAKAGVALVAGPVAGLAVHAIGLARRVGIRTAVPAPLG